MPDRFYRSKEEVKEELQKHKEKLATAKPLHELVFSVDCTVDKVVAETFAISHTPLSEMVFGGKSPVYDKGYTARCTLSVIPFDQSNNLRVLIFKGVSSVRAGDTIKAMIPCYENISTLLPTMSDIDGKNRAYVPREMNKKEIAIELNTLSGKKVIRTERAVDYSTYIPQKFDELLWPEKSDMK